MDDVDRQMFALVDEAPAPHFDALGLTVTVKQRANSQRRRRTAVAFATSGVVVATIAARWVSSDSPQHESTSSSRVSFPPALTKPRLSEGMSVP